MLVPMVSYQKIHPEHVYIGPFTDDEEETAVDSGSALIDVLVMLIRKYKYQPTGKYAKAMGMDAAMFKNSMKALTGMSAHRWIGEYVLLACCDLLDETDLPIAEVARQTGFSSLSNFSQFFNRLKNCSPQDYRNGRKDRTNDE